MTLEHAPRSAQSEPLDPRRLSAAKTAYTTRFVARLVADDPQGYGLVTQVTPQAGDVVLARVSVVGQHARIELPEGRRATLFPGDEVLVAYGHRYAPDQFEAQVPTTLATTHLIAAGGLAGDVTAAHGDMSRPTELEPVGLLANQYGVLTLRRCAPYTLTQQAPERRPTVVAVVGTSMNAGKTTTAAGVVRGLRAAGLTVAAGKVTGTGAGGDPHLFGDAGAVAVLDFTDFGFGSTYQTSEDEVRALLASMVGELAQHHPDAIVLEVADGLYQRETSRLVADPVFAQTVDRVVFAAGDALSAVAGTRLLSELGLRPRLVSGLVTRSPLAAREAEAGGVPVLGLATVASGQVAELLEVGTAAGVR